MIEYQNSKIFIVMRHGERADMVGGHKMKLNQFDPELTENGMNQAISIGKEIRKFFEGKINFSQSNIVVLSSPFARTLQTSKFVIEGISHKNNTIIIDNGLSEYIKKDGFISNPSEFLEYYNNNEYLLSYLGNVKIVENSPTISLPYYPESFDKCLIRYRETLNRLTKKYSMENFDIIIIVTHGYGVQIMSEIMNISDNIYEYDFCTTHMFTYNLESMEFSFIKELKPISND